MLEDIEIAYGLAVTLQFPITDATTGNPLDLTGRTIEFDVYRDTFPFTTPIYSLVEGTGGEVTTTGSDNSIIQVVLQDSQTQLTVQQYPRYKLTVDGAVVVTGRLLISDPTTNPNPSGYFVSPQISVIEGTGATGPAGIPGRGITSATVNGSGHLILTYTDSTTVDAGFVVGPAGANGTNGSSGSNGTNGTNGVGITSAVVNGSGHLILTKTDSSTTDAGYVVGPVGQQGNTGSAGSPGSNGTNGTNGSNGVGVSSAIVNGSGHLILTKTDSSTTDAGYVVGPAGATGSSGVISAIGTSPLVLNYNAGTQALTGSITSSAITIAESQVINLTSNLAAKAPLDNPSFTNGMSVTTPSYPGGFFSITDGLIQIGDFGADYGATCIQIDDQNQTLAITAVEGVVINSGVSFDNSRNIQNVNSVYAQYFQPDLEYTTATVLGDSDYSFSGSTLTIDTGSAQAYFQNCSVYTDYNTLDDGSGNLTVNGNLVVNSELQLSGGNLTFYQSLYSSGGRLNLYENGGHQYGWGVTSSSLDQYVDGNAVVHYTPWSANFVTPISILQSSTSPAIRILGNSIEASSNDPNNGIALFMSYNGAGNRQFCIGATDAVGSSTNGVFRYGTGTPLPTIDGMTGNGQTRLPISLGTDSTNIGIGFVYVPGNYSPYSGADLPASKLTVNGNLAVGNSTPFRTTAAPANGAIIQGAVGIGTTAPTRKLTIDDTSTQYVSFNQSGVEKWVMGNAGSFWGIYNDATGFAFTINQSNSYVGVGTQTPLAPFHVQSNDAAAVYLPVANFIAPNNAVAGNATQLRFGVDLTLNNCAEWRFVYTGSGSTANLVEFGWAGQASPAISYNAANEVGIGTIAPSSMLTVNGDLEALGSASGLILHSTNHRWRLTISDSGAVSIAMLS